MNALWSYFWPVLGSGIAAGVIAGAFGFRRGARRTLVLGLGLAGAMLLAALWHGPLGAADRFSARVERTAHAALQHYEMTKVSAALHHGPLTRQLLLSGPADDFQRTELARLMSQVPGVSRASWTPATGVPLLAEAAGVALLGFLVGLLLAYLVELRRRYNAEWSW
jgi:hypothetical protein